MENLKEFWSAYGELTVIIVCAALAIALIIAAIYAKSRGKMNSRTLTVGAVSVALSMVLNLITVYSMPNGGSVTAGRILPMLIFSYLYGLPAGCILGATYGILDFLAKPYFLNIVQFLLDYPLAFACCGFAAILRNNPKLRGWSLCIGTVIVGLGRFIFSSVSGTLYWGLTFVASMAYNSVLLIDTAVCLVIIFFLTRSRAFIDLLESRKVTYNKKLSNIDKPKD